MWCLLFCHGIIFIGTSYEGRCNQLRYTSTAFGRVVSRYFLRGVSREYLELEISRMHDCELGGRHFRQENIWGFDWRPALLLDAKFDVLTGGAVEAWGALIVDIANCKTRTFSLGQKTNIAHFNYFNSRVMTFPPRLLSSMGTRAMRTNSSSEGK